MIGTITIDVCENGKVYLNAKRHRDDDVTAHKELYKDQFGEILAFVSEQIEKVQE